MVAEVSMVAVCSVCNIFFSFQKVNELCANKFQTLDEKTAFDALSTATDYILPSMEFLTAPTASARDIEVAEKIRNRWCSMLGIDIASKQSMILFSIFHLVLSLIVISSCEYRKALKVNSIL